MRLNRKNIYEINIWPGFVDILGTLLIVTIFTILISTITQIYFNDQLQIKRGEISSLDNELKRLLYELNEINVEKKKIEKSYEDLSVSFKNSENQNVELNKKNKKIEELKNKSDYLLKMKIKELEELVNEKGRLLDNLKSKNQNIKELDTKNKEISLEVFELKRDIDKLNKRLAELSKILIDSEEEDKKNKVIIKNLGKKLNQALAGKVLELKEYQSIFFKKIKEAIGERKDVVVVGDRFIFPSEIFFESGSDVIQKSGYEKLSKIVLSLKDIAEKIPDKIDWILRVDGHTDKVPINNEKFNSNWHLSSSRAINIVKFFINEGIEPHRLVAAGFGENYPIDSGSSGASLQKNRRIEIKLTTR